MCIVFGNNWIKFLIINLPYNTVAITVQFYKILIRLMVNGAIDYIFLYVHVYFMVYVEV